MGLFVGLFARNGAIWLGFVLEFLFASGAGRKPQFEQKQLVTVNRGIAQSGSAEVLGALGHPPSKIQSITNRYKHLSRSPREAISASVGFFVGFSVAATASLGVL